MKDIEEKEIAFIGKITAGVTHEVNNVLASIKELSGLLGDILSLSAADSFPHQEKFQNALPRIQDQVQRGVKLTSLLNKFSHLPDNEITNTDLNDLTEHLILLTQRFARLKNIALQKQSSPQSLSILTNPLQLQMALYYSTQYLLDQMNPGGQININLCKNGEKYSIHILCEGDLIEETSIFKDTSSSEDLATLQEIMMSLKGIAEFNECIPSITLTLPVDMQNV
jgi:signal transduction histidine kinase